MPCPSSQALSFHNLAAGSQEASSPRIPSELHDSPATPVQYLLRRTPPRRQDTGSPRPDDRSLTPSSHRTLRRTPRFSPSPSPSPHPPQTPTPRRIHLEAATLGFSPRPLFSGSPSRPAPAEHAFNSFRRQLSQELSDSPEEAPTALSPAFRTAHRTPSATALRLSKHTKSAILWALEEALRQPHPFSPDLVEENASMADLLGGGTGPATTNGHGASSTRPTAPASQTGSPQQIIRGPRVIMRERAEREARQKAEREQMERARADEEARLLEETQRRIAEQHRQQTSGPVSAGDFSTDPAAQRRQQRAQESAAQAPLRGPTLANPGSSMQQQPAAVPPLRPTRVPATATAPAPQALTTSVARPGINAPAPVQTGESSSQGLGAASRIKNSFPHAFERWEALSAHWEGMTSFWLRRLQENTDEAERNPISTQLSRQVADLSAAGANLFHAVVELQRLRASSERKFQRWFFETRAELERHQEVNAMLEAQMEQERQARADSVRGAAQHEAENIKLQKLVTEMKRELLISKEEARRAWEELGRREQQERDHTVSLQQGHPTIVGGVQVVPMAHSVPSRATSRHTRSQSQTADTSEYVAAQGAPYPSYSHGSGVAAAPPAPASTGSQSAAGYYQQPEGAGPDMGDYGAGGSEAGYSEGEYMIDARGNFMRDEHGNKIPFHSPSASPSRARRSDAGAAEDYDNPAAQVPTSYPPSSSHWAGAYTGQPEYSGQGYAAPGWETLPRHHHPTRLSDVIEEDERSRTSVSQVSRA
ncbi:hypothetical protein C8A05DRAFT_43797 [Staphylotrichum tortipilum]|uniref:Uncharacterized protein n=1 Tax=Staphylotrichum tortipilum TaxID=2831512 RepID=A0AAN6MM90_9PEZI|nr:hypothetical protein C8A05DRAFT_43797 [Staphylotrichum longicolle]